MDSDPLNFTFFPYFGAALYKVICIQFKVLFRDLKKNVHEYLKLYRIFYILVNLRWNEN